MTVFWIAWGLIGGAAELLALFNSHKGDTLSENVWSGLRVKGSRQLPYLWYALRAVTAAVCVWLAGHFAMGWWTF